MVVLGLVKRWSTKIVHRPAPLHSEMSDFRPPSATEPGEAALRRLFASRAVRDYALTSDDLARGSLTVFQSTRVAQPQDASRAPYHVSQRSSSARSYLDTYKQRMLRPASEVADMDTPVGTGSRYVDPVFQHSRRHDVGFVRDLVKGGSVEAFSALPAVLTSEVC